MNIKRHDLVGSSVLVWHLSLRRGMEMYVKVTVGIGFGAQVWIDFPVPACVGEKRKPVAES